MWKRLLVFVSVMACLVGAGRAVMGHSDPTGAAATAGATAMSGAAASGKVTAAGKVTATDANADQAVWYNAATPHEAPIPTTALRLRIIANSDSDHDQAVKRAVRDAIVVQVAKLVQGAKNVDEAKAKVEAALPALRDTAVKVTRSRGDHYPVAANVGIVPFPTKLYGNVVYPAGNYEALRITLGSGKGQNWWCVLFPPLCFVDIADGDAVPNTGGFPDLPPLETLQIPGPGGNPTDVQVRIAALDYGEELWKSVKHFIGGV